MQCARSCLFRKSQSLLRRSFVRQGFAHVNRPLRARMGWGKDVLSDFVPFTAELVTSKRRAFEQIAVSYCPQKQLTTEDTSEIIPRRVEDSWLEIIIPFSDHSELRESFARSDNSTIRYGMLFEILDALAVDVAYRHCGGGVAKQTIVTASVDGVRASSNIDIRYDVKLQGYMTFVGKSSMQITIDIVCGYPDGSENIVGNTIFVMVARDRISGSAAVVPQLLLETDQEKAKFHSGQQRALSRRERATNSLLLCPPRADEVDVIHSLFLKSRKIEIEERSSRLASKEEHKWMKSTVFKNTALMYAQERNVHGKIFGGYLMKTAYELAWATACSFFGVYSPVLTAVDDIQFVNAVNVGSLMEFSSCVIFSRGVQIVIQVDAHCISIYDGSRTKTNNFVYVFEAPPGMDISPMVIPTEYEEFVLYLEGRRSLEKLMEIHNKDNSIKLPQQLS